MRLIGNVSGFWATFLAIAAILGFAATLYSFAPIVSITTSSSLNPNHPFGTIFVVTNDGWLPINSVEYFCGFINVTTENNIRVQRITVGPFEATPKLRNKESHNIPCRYNEINRLTGGAPVKSAEVVITVSYRPSFVIWRRTKEACFATERNFQNQLVWLHKPCTV